MAEQMEDLKSEGAFTISQGAIEMLRDTFASGRASEDETYAAIKSELTRSGELLCPHSAVGVKVGDAHQSDVPMITLATAHPAKFPAAVEKATGQHPPLPPHMADLYEREERVTRVPNDLAALQTLIKERISN